MAREAELLFNKNDWFSLEQHLVKTLEAEVTQFDADRLLSTNPDALDTYFRDRFTLDLPVVREADVSIDHREADIDISNRFDYGFRGYGPSTVRGIEYEVHIPFDGDGGLFNTRPTTFSMGGGPRAYISGQIIVHIIREIQLTPEQLESNVDEFLRGLKQHLSWLKASTDSWNLRLPQQVANLTNVRRQRLIADRTAAATTRFKVRDRPGMPRTFVAPEVRKKVAPSLPPAGTPWEPEPTLDMALYEHILGVITDAAKSWEFSPNAFKSMGEEDLRTQLLFHLNGHYQGGATAETFNKEGKTDILIRSKGRNIFIGECKFWGGARVLTDTINQLLGYTSWHDTKVAVIIFNRNKNFSAVLEQVRPTVEAHPNCKKFMSKVGDAQFRFVFTQPDDNRREMIITVMAFDVPTA